ncbi:MAG TPA: hypothetical protein VG675_09780 [Bryobacteraceae bacterium]|nr:hypothetical protein [Bryobacteraceae bacterium]
MTKVDALAANPDLKLVVVAAMADSLEIHRNHLLFQHKETGQSFATIFVSELRAKGMDDGGILRSLREVRRQVDRQLQQDAVGVSAGARPVLLLGSTVDHSSAATVYSLAPEIGFDSSHVAAVVGVPFYRVSNSNLSSGGLGDVYVSVFLHGRTDGFDVGSTLTLGAPSGDRNKGLGAGKATVDATGTISRRFEFAKPWISAGFANSVFNNVGYQRPYVADGNSAHFAGGVDFALPHRLTLGIGGFGLEPIGTQTVYSQAVPAGSQSGGDANIPGGSGMMPGGGMGTGMASAGGMTMPSAPASSMPFYMAAQQSVVSASELLDYGASIGLSIPVHAGLSLSASVTRSVPFNLTIARVGIAIDAAHLLFRGKHF